MTGLDGNLDDYQLGESLGPPGGYGAAYRAVGRDGRRYVVKLIPGFLDPTEDELLRLETMLAGLAMVDSEHVVPIVDAGIDDATAGRLPWIAMREVPGARSLDKELAARAGPISDAWLRKVLRGIAQGLQDLHAAGLLHRDLKPGNVIVTPDGHASLIDFEIVKVAGLATRTPRAHQPLGTEIYMAPEQLRSIVVPQTDLWALGLILVEALTGEQPLMPYARRGDLRHAIRCASLIPPTVPPQWHPLAKALLHKAPRARPAGAQAVVRWLDDPASVDLLPPPLDTSPPWRWALHSDDDVDAAELAAAGSPGVPAVDAAGAAARHARRVIAAAGSMQALLALERAGGGGAQLSLDDPVPGQVELTRDERRVIDVLRAQADSPAGAVLLPWDSLNDVTVDESISLLRDGLRQRGLAGHRPVIATVQCPLGLLLSPDRTLDLAAALTALRPDGWRLLVDGLDPGCGRNAVDAVRDMAAALASSADVWVRAPGLPRWAFADIPGVSVLYRAGRGLWTRPGGGGPQGRVPERVEVAALAGPVPRDMVERLELAQPLWLHCSCAICRAAGTPLPAPGAPTIVHNVLVAGRRFNLLRDLEPAERVAYATGRLEQARKRRARLPELIGWHGEVDDVDAVLGALTESSPARFRLLRFA